MMTRRACLSAMAGAVAAIPATGTGVSEDGTGRLRFLAFADLHYVPGVYTHDDREWLERILDRARRERVEFVIHAGDFVHDPVKERDFVNFYNDFELPTHHTIGNHDSEGCSHVETLAAYGLKQGHYFFDCGDDSVSAVSSKPPYRSGDSLKPQYRSGDSLKPSYRSGDSSKLPCRLRSGFRIVVLDTNYFKRDGKFVHFERGNYRKWGGLNWTVSEEEYEWAEDVIVNSPHPCIVFMHQSCERENDGMPDWARMRGLFRRINAQGGAKVRLVVNGHHHTDGFRIIDGIPYLDLNSANYKYYAQSHRLFPAEYYKTHRGADHLIAWEDPLSAVITIGQDGYLRIDGMNSRFFHGVSPERAGFPRRDREITPKIQSLEMVIKSLRV